MSAWIHMVPLEEATGSVKDAYELAKTLVELLTT